MKGILDIGQNYTNQLNMYVPKNNSVAVVKELSDDQNGNTNGDVETSETKKDVNQFSEEAKKFLENLKKNRENFELPNKKEKKKDIFVVMERIQKDKDYDFKEYLEDLDDIGVTLEHRKSLNMLYNLRNVKVDRYKEDSDEDGIRFIRKLKEKAVEKAKEEDVELTVSKKSTTEEAFEDNVIEFSENKISK